MKVLYTIDNDYAFVAAASICSLFHNNINLDFDVIIMTNGLNVSNSDKLEFIFKKYNRNFNIINVDEIDHFLKRYNLYSYHGSYVSYYRLFFSNYIDSDDNILYLDADTIITGSIEDLFHFDFKDKLLAAVYEPLALDYKKLINFSESDLYFNSGVLLFNSIKWRDNKCADKIVEFIKHNNRHFVYPDQDILNTIFKNNIISMLPKYNFMPIHNIFDINTYNLVYKQKNYYSDDQLINSQNSPIIIHCYRFLGDNPWSKGSIHPDISIFNYYVKKTKFSNYKSIQGHINCFYSIEKILFKILPKRIFLKIYRKLSYYLLNNKMRR